MPVSTRFVGRWFVPLAALCTSPLAEAQSPAPAEDTAVLRGRLADKLAAPFLSQHAWHTDFVAAQRAAARSGKPIFAHHTRSFVPCGTSIRCEREVLSAPEFAEIAERAVLYCHVTAHLDPEHDRQLFVRGGSGWPHHAVLDATGRVLGRHESYREKSVEDFTDLLDAAVAYRELEARTAAQHAALAREQLEAGLACGALDLQTARRLVAAARPVDPDTATRWERRLTDLEIEELLARHDRFDESQHAVLGEALYGLWRMGKRPEGRNASRDFWGGILLYLESREEPDLDLYGEALGQLESQFGDARGYQRFLDARRSALADLRERTTARRATGG